MRLFAIVFAALIVCGLAAEAQEAVQMEQPMSFPTRDVAVQYKQILIQNGQTYDQGASEQDFYLASPQMMRTTLLAMPQSYALVDVEHRVWRLVTLGTPITYVEMPMEAANASTNTRLTWTRERDETIASLPCTNWRAQMPATNGVRGGALIRCITDDGVTLRETAQIQIETSNLSMTIETIKEAMAVRFASQNPAMFRLPPDAVREAMPVPEEPTPPSSDSPR